MPGPTSATLPHPRRRRHRFAPELMRRVKELCTLDNWHAPLALAYVWSLIAGTIAAPYLLEHWLGWWPMYAVSVILMGFWLRGLTLLLHEGTHRVLAKHPAVNFIASTLCSGYLTLQGFSPYRKSHLDHHIHLGDESKDPDLMFLIAQGVYGAKSRAAFVWKFLISPLLLMRAPARIIDMLGNRFFSKEEPLIEKVGKIAYLALLVGTLVYFGFGIEVLLFWMVPLFTTAPLIAWYMELLEHYPLAKESDFDLHMSRNRWTDPVTKFFLGMFNEHLHQTHHLVPQCPFWRLPAVHEVLMQDAEYRASQFREVGMFVSVVEGTPSILMGIVRGTK